MSFSRIAPSCFYTRLSQKPTIAKATLASSQVGKSALAAGLDIATPHHPLQSPPCKRPLERSFQQSHETTWQQAKGTAWQNAKGTAWQNAKESTLPWLIWAARSAIKGDQHPAPARVLTTLKWSESALFWRAHCSRSPKIRRQIELAPLKVQANTPSSPRGTARHVVKSLLNFCASLAF